MNGHLQEKLDDKNEECDFYKSTLTTQVSNEEKSRQRAHDEAMAKSLVKLAKTICKVSAPPQPALEGESHVAIQDYQGAQVQEVPATEEASDDEDASWIASMNMKAATKME